MADRDYACCRVSGAVIRSRLVWRLRSSKSYDFLWGFWDFLFPPGVIDQTLYPGQSYLMFVTHALLHAGTIHVLMNAVIFIALGKTLALYYGLRLTLMTMLLGAVCSGITFGLLETTAAPMVGASGVVFALIGVWLQMSRAEAVRTGRPARSASVVIISLIVLRYILWISLWVVKSHGKLTWRLYGVFCRSLVCWSRPITDMISVIST